MGLSHVGGTYCAGKKCRDWGNCKISHFVFVYGFYMSCGHFSFNQGDQIQIQYLLHGMVFVEALDEMVADGIILHVVSMNCVIIV